MSESIRILGVMSGSSLDGLDLALCEFSGIGENLNWKVVRTNAVPFTDEWVQRLKKLPHESARNLVQVNFDFGYWIGAVCKEFTGQSKLDYIASHGHTVFHFPEMNSTCQIGKGAAIAARSGYPVVCDFRSADIANGGQGAPIVSIFDRQVLGDYELLMNLGGIANITSLLSEKPIGFDIGPCNQILNYLANMRGLEYDENGRLAASGEVVPDLLEELISIKYLRRPVPKTLDNTEIQNTYIPLFESNQESIENQLRTAIAFIIKSIKYSISQLPGIKTSEEIKILVTGGGANNEFLISQLKAEIDGFNWIFPDKDLIDFKEAIMMAYLAYLRLQKMPNVLASVTGAKKDTVNGVIYWP